MERLEGAIYSLNKIGNQIITIAQDLNSALNRATQSRISFQDPSNLESTLVLNAIPEVGIAQSDRATTDISRDRTSEARRTGSPSVSSLVPAEKTVTTMTKSRQGKSLVSNSPFSKERIQGKILSASEQRILDALAAFESLGLIEIHRSNVAVFANQSPKSSAFTNNLSRLRSQNLIYYPSGGRISLTDHGRTYVKSIIPIDTLTQLHQAWYEKLSKSQAKIVQALVQRYPSAVDRYILAGLVGQSATSSAYTNNLSTLRALGLIDYPRPKQVVVTKLLFPLPTITPIKNAYLT